MTDYYDLTNAPVLEIGTQDFWLNSKGLHRIHRKKYTEVTDYNVEGVTNYITDDVSSSLCTVEELVEFFREVVFERGGRGVNGSHDFIVSPSSGRGRFLLDSNVSSTDYKQKNMLAAISTGMG